MKYLCLAIAALMMSACASLERPQVAPMPPRVILEMPNDPVAPASPSIDALLEAYIANTTELRACKAQLEFVQKAYSND